MCVCMHVYMYVYAIHTLAPSSLVCQNPYAPQRHSITNTYTALFQLTGGCGVKSVYSIGSMMGNFCMLRVSIVGVLQNYLKIILWIFCWRKNYNACA